MRHPRPRDGCGCLVSSTIRAPCQAHALARGVSAVPSRGIDPERQTTGADFNVLASAMRKMLPPELLAEVIAHLDPLTPFVEYLRGDSVTAPGAGQ